MPDRVSHINAPPLLRRADVQPGTLDMEARTVEVVASTGYLGKRSGFFEDFDEELVVTEEAVDLRRLNSTGAVLDNHRTRTLLGPTSVRDSVIGAVVPGSARVADGQLLAQLRFADTTAGKEILGMVRDGIIRAVSVGYDPEYEEIPAKKRTDGGTRTLLRATKWEPYEISVVPMGFDPSAVMRSAEPGSTRRYAVRTRAEDMMPEPKAETIPTLTEADVKRATEAATLRALDITEAGQRAGADPATVRALIADHTISTDAAKLRMYEAMAEKTRATQTQSQTPLSRGKDEADKIGEAIGLGLMHRALGQADPRLVRSYNKRLEDDGKSDQITPAMTDETSKRVMRSRLIDVAERFLQSRGIPTGGMSTGQIAEAALSYRAGGVMGTTADFPNLLANTANKMLSVGYSEPTSPWREIGIARRLDRDDFKTFTMLRRSGAPGLARINEHGEIKRSGWADGTSLTGQLKTAGVEVAFTRQMLINDDLNAFAQQNLGLGDSAIRWEDDYVITTILYGNPTLSDSVALFDSTRGNLSTDVGAPDLASIIFAGHMFAAMTETIKDPENNNGSTTRKINVGLTGFLCALTEKLTIDSILEPRFPDAASNKLPTQLQGLRTFQDNRLQVETAAPDVHFALSNRTALVYGGLTGDPSPRLSMQATTGTDGVIWQVIHDWYCDVEDPKAIIRIPKS